MRRARSSRGRAVAGSSRSRSAVPEQWKDYYTANVDFFTELGSPGGAAKVGKIERDHPLVAALPPQNPDEWAEALGASPFLSSPGTASPGRSAVRRSTPTGPSTCPSAPRWIRCPNRCALRCRPRPRCPVIRPPTAPPSCAGAWSPR